MITPDSIVGYLHRTVKDFLVKPETRYILADQSGQTFDPSTHILKSCILQLKALAMMSARQGVGRRHLINRSLSFARRAEQETKEVQTGLLNSLAMAARSSAQDRARAKIPYLRPCRRKVREECYIEVMNYLVRNFNWNAHWTNEASRRKLLFAWLDIVKEFLLYGADGSATCIGLRRHAGIGRDPEQLSEFALWAIEEVVEEVFSGLPDTLLKLQSLLIRKIEPQNQ
ncbi:uncharacterized protein PAC_01576 [Phialocephala subalpina]|uniref:DUF7791 domain-containing protein n=1 Tax=Phialocephala subalpina TaxID=576137 RepID=A0A1L7WG31_9HELO|nr:uncharacterized protein PAC_01576 [Phialocephala subalpina]